MTEEINAGLAPMFEKAYRENLLFRSNYQHVLFKPDELKAAQANGQFRWGAENWALVSAKDIYNEKLNAVKRAEREAQEFARKYL